MPPEALIFFSEGAGFYFGFSTHFDFLLLISSGMNRQINRKMSKQQRAKNIDVRFTPKYRPADSMDI